MDTFKDKLAVVLGLSSYATWLRVVRRSPRFMCLKRA